MHTLIAGLNNNAELTEEDKIILQNFGGGHYNHSLFWQFMSPKSDENKISQLLRDRIEKDFDSLEKFKEKFTAEAKKISGNGWCWWVFDNTVNKSFITITNDEINPIMENSNLICLLGLDLFEHAYSLNFTKKRSRYIDGWWNVVDWNLVSKIHDVLVYEGKPIQFNTEGNIIF